MKFTNGSNIIEIAEDGKVRADFLMKIEELDDSFYVHLPAYNIHFYSTSKDEIKNIAHDSLFSFLNYWIKVQSLEKFATHMQNLGFSTKKSTNKTKGTGEIIHDVFELA
jgi:hypothetical protein